MNAATSLDTLLVAFQITDNNKLQRSARSGVLTCVEITPRTR